MSAENQTLYFDDSFYGMDTEQQIAYLKENPEETICPDDVEGDYFWCLYNELEAAGEKELSLKVLEMYCDASIQAQKASHDRIRPSFDAIYTYGMHLLGGKVTPFKDIPLDIKKIFINFCILNTVVYTEDLDEFVDEYPQMLEFYKVLPQITYADYDAVCPQLLRNVGLAYRDGTKVFEKNPGKAFEFFLTGARFDYDGRQIMWPFTRVAECAFEVATCFMKGIGVPKDLNAALEYFKFGAENSGLGAVPAMAEIYLDPEFDWEDFCDTEEELIIAAFEAYNVDPCDMQYPSKYADENWDLDFEDADKDKNEKNKKHIFSKLTELAKGGSQAAAIRLANAYENGILTQPDEEQAIYYHKMVMDMGGESYSALYLFKHSRLEERDSCKIPENLEKGDKAEYGNLLGKPLIWQVYDKDEELTYLITRDIVVCRSFDNYSADYESSELRRWLNEDFCNKVFTDEEREELNINEFKVHSYSKRGLIDIADKVLISSPSEIEEYFGEGNPWEVSHTELALATGGSTECWTRWSYGPETPIHVDKYGKVNERMRYHAGMTAGVRPVIAFKNKK